MGGGSGALPGDNPGTEMRQAGAVMTPCGVTWARQNGERICLPRRNAGRRRGGCGLGKPPDVWRADQLLCLRDLHHPVLWRPMGSRVCGVWTRSLRRDQAPRGAVWRTDSDDAARAAGCALVCASTCRPCSAQRCMCRFRVVGRSIITSRRWSGRREAEVVPHAASTGLAWS